MSYTERLAQALNKAPARVIIQPAKKAYEWQREANAKRAIR